MKIQEPNHSADRLQTLLCLNIDQLSPDVTEESLSIAYRKIIWKKALFLPLSLILKSPLFTQLLATVKHTPRPKTQIPL